jgi:hypothetical protein
VIQTAACAGALVTRELLASSTQHQRNQQQQQQQQQQQAQQGTNHWLSDSHRCIEGKLSTFANSPPPTAATLVKNYLQLGRDMTLTQTVTAMAVCCHVHAGLNFLSVYAALSLGYYTHNSPGALVLAAATVCLGIFKVGMCTKDQLHMAWPLAVAS